MSPLVERQLAEVAQAFAGASGEELPDGSVLVRLPDVALPGGWNRTAATMLFIVPVGYPAAKPDCFWAVPPPLRPQAVGQPQRCVLANGNEVEKIPHRPEIQATWFSWHANTWDVARSTLLTYANFVMRRFEERK
jgi:hypothetical protein